MKKYDCNNCENASCKGDVLRNDRFEFKRWIACRGWQKPAPMKTPLLYIALGHGSATAINEILKRMDMKFQEIDRYPYFRLIL